jgi:thymidylate synthase ThyX
MSRECLSNPENPQNVIEEYISLGNKLQNPPTIYLELISTSPTGGLLGSRDIVATTAVQCYSPGIAKMKERRDEKSENIAESTLQAGHHTTRMHMYYTWKIVGATRSVIHDVLHGNPFYNSEQQSQRYVETKEDNYLVPKELSQEQKTFYMEAASFANKAYFELLSLLSPFVTERVKLMYPQSGWKVWSTEDRLNSKAKKNCQEVARYVLPVAQYSTLDHTLSELQLLRLFRASRMPNFSDEARFIIGSMIKEVAAVDETIMKELELPINPEENQTFKEEYILEQKRDFDVGLQGKQSMLVGCNSEGLRTNLAKAVRNVLGIPESRLSDSEALSLLMSPAFNKHLSDVYEIGMLHPLSSVLRQTSFTFYTKISHTGDSQRQRQRRTPGATPSIFALYDGIPDFETPLVIRENQELKRIYDAVIFRMFENVDRALELGIPKEYALLLLPNALSVRLTESGDLFDWLHRWKQRLCYLAQEEIFFVSVDQVEQVAKVLPETSLMLLAPCGLRQKAGVRPRCPEGERWCGKPVFNWQIEKYKKERLI